MVPPAPDVALTPVLSRSETLERPVDDGASALTLAEDGVDDPFVSDSLADTVPRTTVTTCGERVVEPSNPVSDRRYAGAVTR